MHPRCHARHLTMLVALTACATASSSRPSSAPVAGDVLTFKELLGVASTTQNAYSAVERLRPRFLIARPGLGTLREHGNTIYVFVNDNFAGDVEVLKTIPLRSVHSIELTRATEAFTRLGTVQPGASMVRVRVY